MKLRCSTESGAPCPCAFCSSWLFRNICAKQTFVSQIFVVDLFSGETTKQTKKTSALGRCACGTELHGSKAESRYPFICDMVRDSIICDMVRDSSIVARLYSRKLHALPVCAWCLVILCWYIYIYIYFWSQMFVCGVLCGVFFRPFYLKLPQAESCSPCSCALRGWRFFFVKCVIFLDHRCLWCTLWCTV